MTHTGGDLLLNLLERGQECPPRFSVSRLGTARRTPRTPLLGPVKLPLAQALSAPSRRRDRSERPIFDITAADIAIRRLPTLDGSSLGAREPLAGTDGGGVRPARRGTRTSRSPWSPSGSTI